MQQQAAVPELSRTRSVRCGTRVGVALSNAALNVTIAARHAD